VPLVTDEKSQRTPGWCTYSDAFDSPEIELLSGGINHKTATAAAIWRQGNLLHFGVDLSPEEMNERGRGLLLNSIVYIAGFTDDRPITHAPERAWPRCGADRIVAQKAPDQNYVQWYFSPKVRALGHADDWPTFQAWYAKNRAFLRAERKEHGCLVLDEEARALGVPPGQLEFFPAAIAALTEGGAKAERAATLLRRYASLGPEEPVAEKWQR
jgi:hypothetical protein